MTLFTGAVSALRSELTSKGYTDATSINQTGGEYALLIENHDLSRLEVKVSGDGLTLTPGLTNQNLAVSQATGTFTCLHNTYVKSSGVQLLANFTDDTFLGQLQTATSIAASNWVDRSLYEITLGANNTFTFTFKDLFEPGYILLPLADLDYQLDQLPSIPTGEATILTVGTRNFARTRVEANRFLIPGTTNRYFIALILNVQATGEFPNFVVSATAPTGNMVNYLGIGASDLSGTMRLGWAGLNTTTGQYSPATSAAYTLGLATRQVTQQVLTSVAASDAVINQFVNKFEAQFPTLSFVDPATYSEVVTGATATSRTVTYNYVLGYDKDATSAVSVYTVPNNLITALTEASSAGNPVVMTMGSTTYTASQFLDAIVQDSGVFYFGHPITVQGTPQQFTYSFTAKPSDDSWIGANWTTNIVQVIPEPVVIPVVNVAFDNTYQMANIAGGVDQGFKKVRFRYETDNLGIISIAASVIPSGGSLTVSAATNVVSVDSDYPLTLGGTVYPAGVLYRVTAADAVLELEYKVPSSNVNQVVGVNGIDYVPVTTNGVWDGEAGTATLGNKEMFVPMFVGGNVTPTTVGNVEVPGVYHRYTETFDDGDIIAFQAGKIDFCFNKGALPGTHLRGAVEGSGDGDVIFANLGVESFVLSATDISRGYWFSGTDISNQVTLNTVAGKYYTAKRLGTSLEVSEWVLGTGDEPNVFVANQVVPNVFAAGSAYTVEFLGGLDTNHVTEIYREDPVSGHLKPLDIGTSTVRYMHVANAPVLAIADPVVIPEIPVEECPVFDMTGAQAVATDIELTGNWQVYNDCVEDGVPVDPAALKAKLEADDPNVAVHILNPISCAGSKSVTEPMELTGRWFIEVDDVLISSEDMSLEQAKTLLLAKGIELQIIY